MSRPGVLRNARELVKGLPEQSRAQYDDRGPERIRTTAAGLENMLKRYLATGITSIKDREATPEQEIPVYTQIEGSRTACP